MGKTNRCGSAEPGRSPSPKQQKRARKHVTHECHCRKWASQPFRPVLSCSPSRPPGNYLSIRMERRFPEVAGRPVSNALRALSLQ